LPWLQFYTYESRVIDAAGELVILMQFSS